MTKRTWIIVAVALVAHLAYADTLVGVYVNGTKQDFSPPARVREGTTYAPLRAAAEAVGADVKWIESEQIAIICQGDACAIIRKQQGIIVSGRLLIPVRLMAEALEASVSWDAQNKRVLIKTRPRQAAAPLINLARTNLASVSGSSVNGMRSLDNPYYGILNAFDNGTHYVEGINYSYWLTSSQPSHWLEVRFDVPVTVVNIHVEANSPYSTQLLLATGGELSYAQRQDQLTFHRTAGGLAGIQAVTGIRLNFRTERLLKVHEVRVIGFPPPSVRCRECVPGLFATPQYATLRAQQEFASWMMELRRDPDCRLARTDEGFEITFFRGKIDLCKVFVPDKGKPKLEVLADFAPLATTP